MSSKSASKLLKEQPKIKSKKRMPSTGRVVNIDVLTGQEIQRVYFDPTRAIGVLIPDDDWLGDHLFVAASIVGHDEKNDTLSLKVPSGEVYKVPRNSVAYISSQDDEGVSDILKLHKFSEMSLVYTLRVRYNRDEVYTFVGPILIAINPYKWLADLYSEETMAEYHSNKAKCEEKPHLFHIAEAAFVALMTNTKKQKRNQSIIISGESGAGKTESTKVIMAYLARITTMDHCHSKDGHTAIGQLEQRVLNTNPILEAFGNAKTLRNDNSSRFGKYIKIEFDTSGKIIGATIEKYLLEKTRVIHQILGERNFHIFYQLLRGSSADVQNALGVKPTELSVENFRYLLNSSEATFIDHVSDETEFGITRTCMDSVGIETETQVQVFRLLLAILLLGNVNFDEEDGAVSHVSNETTNFFRKATSYLGLDEASFLEVISKRNMHVNGSIIVKNQTLEQAQEKKDTFSKSIYAMLFGWLVEKINKTISPREQRNLGFIGVLDIYGFENFEGANGFEQLLINYANEKLQNHFNKHIFLVEQAEYDKEGIDWSYVKFKDNQMCVDLLEGRPLGRAGVFQTLDDVLSTGGNSSDSNSTNAVFLTHLNSNWSQGKHPNFISPRFNIDQKFGILHYAGEVFYEIEHFAEKNKDSMNSDMRSLLSTSSNAILREMTEISIKEDNANGTQSIPPSSSSSTAPGSGRSKSSSRRPSANRLKGQSISKQFSNSLRHLYEVLDSTQPHFVRCIKPNNYKRADHIDAFKTLTQLKYAGMMETIRIRRQGYALRELHMDFFKRYSPLEPTCESLNALVTKLSVDLSASAESWQVGTTKIFLRSEMSEKLEHLLRLRFSSCARIIQKFWRHIIRMQASKTINRFSRRYLARSYFIRCVHSILIIQTAMRRLIAKKRFQAALNAVKLLQCCGRRLIARNLMRKLQNPYSKLSYEEINSAIKSANAELQNALESKNFHLCEGIQQKIKDMEVALMDAEISVPLPSSRNELELFILEEEFHLQHLTESKQDVKICKANERLQLLNSMKSDFPTVAEVEVAINNAKGEMERAVAQKEFSQCANLQKKIDSLELQLVAVRKLEGPPNPASSNDLKTALANLNSKFQEEVNNKNFSECEQIQKEIDRLKLLDLMPNEYEKKIQTANEKLAEAKQSQNFHQMALAHVDIELYRNLLPVDDTGNTVSEISENICELQEGLAKDSSAFSGLSGKELRSTLAERKRSLDEALAQKKYSLCHDLERDISEITQVLDNLPFSEQNLRYSEIVSLLDEKKLSFNKALKNKCYSDMERIDKDIDALNELLSAQPSEEDLKNKIRGLEKQLKLALTNKEYKVCEDLEEKLAEARVFLREIETKSQPSTPNAPARPSFVAGATVVKHNTDSKAVKGSAPVHPQSEKVDAKSHSVAPKKRPSFRSKGPSAKAKNVSQLRPRKPLTLSDRATILESAELMSSHRTDSIIITNKHGKISGILTDNDLTRRVVAKDLDTDTGVKTVMTKQPKCVSSDDPALDALEMMVENRFRHLPVLDKSGSVVGLLDIAKCLYDAISALEKVQNQEEDSTASTEALVGMMAGAMQKAAGGRGAHKSQLAAMQAMMTQMFGGSVPTLRTIIGDSAFVSVSPVATVREASKAMADIRKGVLVMDARDELVGIFTPKDLLNRVIAKGLSPDSVVVSEVMTANPDCVSPDLTLLDALREMHDQKYLHLPVRDDDGGVLGMVDVMELVCHSAGGEEGTGKGWRDFFHSAMNARGDDEGSETSSLHSGYGSTRSKARSRVNVKSTSSVGAPNKQRPVSKLRPKVPLTVSDSASVLQATEMMASKRVDAALLVNSRGELSGILTDNDLTRRVVAKDLDTDTGVKTVMTKQPKCVSSDDPALDALEMMVENRFRHLPVLDKSGSVVGLLDIAKCLYDAISALEKVQNQEEDSTASTEALVGMMTGAMQKAAGGPGTHKSQLAAMQAMMTQMFGGSVPTLRTIIGDSAFVSVSPVATVREASKAMADICKGVLVMDARDELVGIFTPKDLLNRVIAKGLSPDSVVVSEVMTANPDCVSPDLTLLDALREMHDQKYLHLPVRDDDGGVLGMVDVMELVCHSAGGEEGTGKGWRDFFHSAMNARGDDEGSETSSLHSGYGSTRSKARSRVNVKSTSSVGAPNKQRPVSKLRPKVPLTVSDSASVLQATEMMASKRVDAALLVNSRGELSGILTDNDLTRRVVAKDLDTDTGVKTVMTKQPKCVSSDDPALDALEMMVENRFRHLPVLDKSGSVVGLLDIAKCLYDAISALEKVQNQEEDSTASTEALVGMMAGAMQKATGGRGAHKSQLAAMQAMMTQMFGGSVPTLRTIIGDSAFVSVSPVATVREASKAMADIRKGVLVMDARDELVGIFTPKDLLNRVIAKGLSPDSVVVSEVMTANPDCVSPDLTLLDALREMHDQKYLHLPVRDDDGGVLGMVDVMELVCHSAGGEEGTGKGWRDFFHSAMNARGDDEGSETSSLHSGYGSTRSKARSRVNVKSTSSVGAPNKQRPVSKLRPKVPLTVSDSASVLQATEMMASKRVDAALLVNSRGELSGILTDNDLTRRVVAKDLDTDTGVKTVMTKQPKCVSSDDPALDALEMMVENRFRHLPVLDKSGSVVGLLDIAKCLYDAISALEKVQNQEEDSTASTEALVGMMAGAMQKATGGRGAHKSQLAAMQAMMTQMFGGSVPTLRTIIGDSAFVSVSPVATVREASKAMADIRKGVLVMDARDELVGIFTPKDLLNRVIAKGLSPDSVVVSEVMTANPDCVSPDLTLLDALREMHDQKYLHLPVRDDDGGVLGMVDVMELVCHSAGGEEGTGKGWRDFFHSAMNARGDDEGSETSSLHSGYGSTRSKARSRVNVKSTSSVGAPNKQRPVSKLRPKVPLTVSDSASVLQATEMMASKRVDAALLVNSRGELSGILTDNDLTRRVVAKDLDTDTGVKTVMTKQPKCVSSDDPALDALEMMVENRFRHLPVLDKSGSVVGLLDIAKCLYDAISALEKVQNQEEDSTASTEALVGMMAGAMQKAAGGRGAHKSQLAAMQAMMTQMFGGSVPTLRTIIGDSAFVSVSPVATVREASKAMADIRKGVLVMDARDELVGIFTPKDLLNRVIAKGLSPDSVVVSEVMTANPDCVSPDLTLLDALREMHDQKYLHLPVRDDDGGVLGMVDVMELVCHSAGGEEGTGKGWRDFFHSAMNARGDDEGSETSSLHSGYGSTRSKARSRVNVKSTSSVGAPNKQRPVSKLRPKVPISMLDCSSILEVCKEMAHKKVDAVLLVNKKDELSGILTDNDLTRRVVSKFGDVDASSKTVMTKQPKCVSSDDPALDALEMMVENRFRHLPVLDKSGSVVGLLDIAKCLYDAISALEKVQNQEEDSTASTEALVGMMTGAMQKAAGGRGAHKSQLAAMQAMMTQMFGGSVPTLAHYLEDKNSIRVRSSINVREACCVMTKRNSGLLVMDGDDLMGIFTPRDVLKRVLSKNKSPDITALSSVMMRRPRTVSSRLTMLEALREMLRHKCYYLVVEDDDGNILGLVDVMELVSQSAGGVEGSCKGWRDFFSEAMNVTGEELPDADELNSENSSNSASPSGKPAHVVQDTDNYSDVFSIGLMTDNHPNMSVSNLSAAGNHDTASVMASKDFVFKIADKSGNYHRIKCKSESLAALKGEVANILGMEQVDVVLTYVDDDNDEVVIGSDVAVSAAIDFCRYSKKSSLKVNVSTKPNNAESGQKKDDICDDSDGSEKKTSYLSQKASVEQAVVAETYEQSDGSTTKMIAVGGVLLALASIGFIFSRRKN